MKVKSEKLISLISALPQHVVPSASGVITTYIAMLKSLLPPTPDSRVQRFPTLYWVQEHITKLRQTAGTKTLMHT